MNGLVKLVPRLGRTAAVARPVEWRLPGASARACRVRGHRCRSLLPSGLRGLSARALPILTVLSVLHIGTSWAGMAMADIQLAMSRPPPPDEIRLGPPALSPDGQLAALYAYYSGEPLPWLFIFDLEREEVRRIDKPANEGWLSPSFSSSGERIVFTRYCAVGCARDRKGFQVSILDLKTGLARTVTRGDKLFRASPIFSPDDRSIVYTASAMKWVEDGTRHDGIGFWTLRMLDSETGSDLKILNDELGSEEFSDVFPAGFLDVNTLAFNARRPHGPLFAELERLARKEGETYEYAKYAFLGIYTLN